MFWSNLLSRWNTKIWASTLPREPEDLAALAPATRLQSLFEFIAWPKTARLLRDIVITEKLDGTNAAIQIRRVPTYVLLEHLAAGDPEVLGYQFADSPDTLVEEGSYWVVGAQSRNRVISAKTDNQGFAKWVQANAATLIEDLGEGLHFGEFWGNKIGRGYGLPEGDRRFSLFNPAFEFKSTVAHADGDVNVTVIQTPGLDVVPALYSGPFEMSAVRQALIDLQAHGSAAVPGYLKPEGVIVYHTHARRIVGKVTLDNQDAGKWEA